MPITTFYLLIFWSFRNRSLQVFACKNKCRHFSMFYILKTTTLYQLYVICQCIICINYIPISNCLSLLIAFSIVNALLNMCKLSKLTDNYKLKMYFVVAVFLFLYITMQPKIMHHFEVSGKYYMFFIIIYK